MIAAVSACCGGCGAILIAAGAASSNLILAATGAAAIALGLFPMLQAHWVHPLIFMAVSLPLPAVFGNDSIRVAAAAPATALVLVAWLCERTPTVAPRLRDPDYMYCLGSGFVLLAVLSLTAVTAISKGSAVREVLNLAVIFALLPVARDLLVRDVRASHALLKVLTILCGVCGVLAVLETVGILPAAFPRWGTSYFRAALGLGQPNGLGLFFALLLPFVAALTWNETRRLKRTLCLAALAATSAGLFVTFSRGAWVSVIFGSGLLLFAGEWRRVLRIIAGVIVAAVIIDLVSGGGIRDTIERTLTDWVVEQRFGLMLAGLSMFVARPLTGVGPGGFASQLDGFGAQIPSLWDYLPTPHNAYVQMAAESGAAGLIAYLCLLLVVGRALVLRARNGGDPVATAALWSFGVLCCSGLFIWPFAHGTGQVAMLAMALGLARPLRPNAT